MMREGFYSLEKVVGQKYMGVYLYTNGNLVFCYNKPKLMYGEDKERMMNLLENNEGLFIDSTSATFHAKYYNALTKEDGVAICRYSYEESDDSIIKLKQFKKNFPYSILDDEYTNKREYSLDINLKVASSHV